MFNSGFNGKIDGTAYLNSILKYTKIKFNGILGANAFFY